MDSEAGRVELLPCPFCGDAEELDVRQRDGGWFAICGACAGCMYADSRGGAIAGWNTRPTPDNGLREALERIRDGIVGAIKRDDGPNVLIWGGHRIEGPAADAVFAISEAIIEACDAALQHNTGERG